MVAVSMVLSQGSITSLFFTVQSYHDKLIKILRKSDGYIFKKGRITSPHKRHSNMSLGQKSVIFSTLCTVYKRAAQFCEMAALSQVSLFWQTDVFMLSEAFSPFAIFCEETLNDTNLAK